MNTLSEERFAEINEFHQSTASRVKKFLSALSANGQHCATANFCNAKALWKIQVFRCVAIWRWVRLGAHYPHVTWDHVMLTRAVGMWEAILHWILWCRFTLLSLCLRHVILHGAVIGSRASTPLKFLLSHTFRETWSTCRALFRRYQLFPETEEMLIERVHQRTFL